MPTTTKPKIADRPIGELSEEVFTAVALLNVYFFVDLAYAGVKTKRDRNKLLKTIQKAGYLDEVEDVEECTSEIKDLYDSTLEAHVKETFPEGWDCTHDYWGAKCFCFKPGWNAPKGGTKFTGDSGMHYMAFNSARALWDYTKETLEEI